MLITFTNKRHRTAATIKVFETQENKFIKLAFVPDDTLDMVADLLCPDSSCRCAGFDQKPYWEIPIPNWFEIPKIKKPSISFCPPNDKTLAGGGKSKTTGKPSRKK